jgi:glycosyltransferase involved in cell wall biosynthesis
VKNSMISVCLATYNGEKYIREQLISILVQLSENDECIIQDDCSSDNTVSIIKNINDERIKLRVNNENIGYQQNFSKAIERAKGDVIFLSDQDDIWHQDKVIKTMKGLSTSDAFFSNAKIVDSFNVDNGSYFSGFFIKLPNKLKIIYSLIKPRYLGCCMAFKAKSVKKIIPLSDKVKGIPHDYIIGSYLLLFAKVKFSNEKLINYRRHGNNVSSGNEKSKNNLIFKVKYRFTTLKYLLRSRYGFSKNN